MSGIYYNGSSGGGGGGIVTIDGDVSSASGSTITLTGGTSGAVFTGDGASTITESFNFLALPATADDGTSGYISMGGIVAFHAIGTYNAFGGPAAATDIFTGVPSGAGSSYNASFGAYSFGGDGSGGSITGSNNSSLGFSALGSIGDGNFNCCLGSNSLTGCTNGSGNVAIGFNALMNTNADNNIAIGTNALSTGGATTGCIGIGNNSGSNYINLESNNIVIAASGVAHENNVLRIGDTTGSTGANHIDKVFICGINGVDLTSTSIVTNSGNQLGQATLTAGSGVTISTSAGEIVISASSASSSSTTYVDSTPYTVLLTDSILLVDTVDIGIPISILLPDAPPTDGQTWTVKDWDGEANVFPITVSTVSSLSILDGQTSVVLSNSLESVSFVWSESRATYSIVSEVSPSIISLPATTTSSGVIEIGGSVVMHAFGTNNIFVGPGSGNFSVSGTDNSSLGFNNLSSLTSGSFNVSAGSYAMSLVQDGTVNVGIGYGCLGQLVSGSSNSVAGENGFSNLVGGNFNLGMGQFCGANYTGNESSNIMFNNGGTVGESNVLRIGSGTGTSDQQLNAAFISGIQGITVGVSGVPVVVDVNDQLGTVVSSIRYKENVSDMGDVSSPILNLRPVTFDFIGNHYDTKNVGLIAEEVNDIMPSLVVHNKEGQIQTVKYQDLSVLLLNELQKAVKRIEALEAQLKG